MRLTSRAFALGAVCLAVTSSCISPDATGSVMTVSGAATTSRIVELRQLGKMVGELHNRGLEDMRKHRKVLYKADACERLTVFFTMTDRYQSARHAAALSAQDRKAIVRAGVQKTGLCRPSKTGSSVIQTSYSSNAARGALAKPDIVADLIAAIKVEAMAATSARDLAFRLSPIYEAAATLSEGDGAVVAAVAGVTQSSYEYWVPSDTALTRYTAEAGVEYAGCFANIPLSEDPVPAECLPETLFTRSPLGQMRPQIRLASHSRPVALLPACNHLSKRSVLESDFEGAVGGAIGGLIVGGPAGAGAGALGGGVGASGARALLLGFKQSWCLSFQT